MRVSREGSKTDIINRILRVHGDQPPIHPNPPSQANRPNLNDDRMLRLQRRLHYTPTNAIIRRKKKKAGKRKHKLKKKDYLSLQFVGIRAPRSYTFRNFISTYVSDIKIASLNIKTTLEATSTVSKLKKYLKKVYGIPAQYDVLILYSHMVISHHNRATLRHFGITNHSVLTIAVCMDTKQRHYDRYTPYTYQHLLSALDSTEQQLQSIQKGLDIITQETDATLYKMPICGHHMSRESLFLYAMSHYMNPSNVYLRCPHTKDSFMDDSKYNDNEDPSEWSCVHCTYVNNPARCQRRGKTGKCAICNEPKPQHLSHATNQCNAVWHYVLIKSILLASEDGSDALDLQKLELLSARNQLVHNKDESLNVQKCHRCKTLYFKNKKHARVLHRASGYKKFRSKCLFCKCVFCWNCGKQFARHHQCDGSFQLQIIHLLQTCMTKTIGYVSNVPSIRCCPNVNCSQLITHVSACKHMRCRSCSTSFCFVCMKEQVNGRWQCGGSSDRCTVAPRQTLRNLNKRRNLNITIKKSFQLLD